MSYLFKESPAEEYTRERKIRLEENRVKSERSRLLWDAYYSAKDPKVKEELWASILLNQR